MALNSDSATIKRDIACLILQYLQDEGYTTSFLTMQDETKIKLAEKQTQRSYFKRMRKAVLDGDWVEVDKLCGKTTFQQQKSFLYAAYREQFIELIDAQEYQKAFTHLTKRLKPLEGSAASLSEFKDLCYLLTCRSVHEVLPNWEGAAAAREALLSQFATMLEMEERWTQQESQDDTYNLPERRLLELLEQAAAYQVSRSARGAAAATLDTATSSSAAAVNGGSGGHGRAASCNGAAANGARPNGGTAPVTSLLRDYTAPCVPNTPYTVLRGHTDGVKSVAWLPSAHNGYEGGGSAPLLLSAGNDMTVRLWSARDGQCLAALDGHTARVWQLAVSKTGQLVASAAADGTVRLWRVGDATTEAWAAEASSSAVNGSGGGGSGNEARMAYAATLSGHTGDVYSVGFHPSAEQVVTAGYDRSVRLFDASIGVESRVLVGHELPAREAVFNSTGNLVVSGGKDATVRFWDVRSALCVRKLSHSLGEVTSVQLSQDGTQLLASSKDNSIRLWDVRAARPLRAFKGHQNTSKNFVRARFGPARDLVLSGSEDGCVCVWSLASAELLHKLRGHTDVSYDAVWCEEHGLLASCSHDGTVRTWRHDPGAGERRNGW